MLPLSILPICWCYARISPHAMLRKWHLLPFAPSFPSSSEHKDKSETEFKQMTKLIPSDIYSCSFFIECKECQGFFCHMQQNISQHINQQAGNIYHKHFLLWNHYMQRKNILSWGLGSPWHGMYTEWEAWDRFDWRSNTLIHLTFRVNNHALIP